MPDGSKLVAMLIAAGMLATACGSDGSGGAAPSPSPEPALSAAFCDAAAEIEALFAQAPDDPAEIQTFYTSEVEPLLMKIEAEAPDDLATAIATLKGATTTLFQTGDFSVVEAPAFVSAEDELDEQLLDGCEGQKLTIDAVDYAFEGVPDSLPAGRAWIRFTNKGTELHEMVLVRRNEGVTETFQELLELSEEEAQDKVTLVAAGYETQGEWDGVAAQFEPGEHAMVCFVPVGSVDPTTEVEGPPHFTRGMIAEFTVT